VLGGRYNTAADYFDVILGGSGNSITAEYSMVYGLNVTIGSMRTIGFYNSQISGKFGLNRDDGDGGILYPMHVGTTNGNGGGAYLSWEGYWYHPVSQTSIGNSTLIDGTELLSKISGISINAHNYANSTEKHIGPVAEEFVQAFDTGVIRDSDGKRDDMYLSSGDVAGVALAGVQELLKIIEQQNVKIKNLEIEMAELKAQSE
jgi:hypothetical protein